MIELKDDTYSVFELKFDAIQASFVDSKPGFEKASFQYGSFAWME